MTIGMVLLALTAIVVLWTGVYLTFTVPQYNTFIVPVGIFAGVALGMGLAYLSQKRKKLLKKASLS